jgi:hypothetical protein
MSEMINDGELEQFYLDELRGEVLRVASFKRNRAAEHDREHADDFEVVYNLGIDGTGKAVPFISEYVRLVPREGELINGIREAYVYFPIDRPFRELNVPREQISISEDPTALRLLPASFSLMFIEAIDTDGIKMRYVVAPHSDEVFLPKDPMIVNPRHLEERGPDIQFPSMWQPRPERNSAGVDTLIDLGVMITRYRLADTRHNARRAA